HAGPITPTPTTPANATAAPDGAPRATLPRAINAAVAIERPTTITIARPRGPKRSLSHPVISTDAAPTPGKTELQNADRASDIPTKPLKYVGVQVLNVSRTNVVPNDSAQTSQNCGLLASGRSTASAPLP